MILDKLNHLIQKFQRMFIRNQLSKYPEKVWYNKWIQSINKRIPLDPCASILTKLKYVINCHICTNIFKIQNDWMKIGKIRAKKLQQTSIYPPPSLCKTWLCKQKCHQCHFKVSSLALSPTSSLLLFLPDTFLSVKDAVNGKFYDSFSNAYGSNMFDICIGLGLPLLVYTSIHGTIYTNFPISRIGSIGNYILGGNVLLCSAILLLILTITTTCIYYFKPLSIRYAILIIFLYLFFMLGLILF